jgi:hypothetical protein
MVFSGKMCGVEFTPRARFAAGLIALLALAGLTVLSLFAVAPPAARGADAPADDFSAARAFAHVQQVGSQVHVGGSPAAEAVRAYLETTLDGLGLRTEVQEAVGSTDALGGGFAMARVRNLIAVLPGTDSTGRVFLVAHYDSAQVSFGGNDDGAGVAALLETARALAQGPRPRNDIVFVFTDGEEACLCGAEAFVSQHALAADGGVVLNFEARGSSGPAIMFETSPGNAGVVGVYGDAAPHPVGTSFAVEVYRILPNDTDFTPFLDAGRFVGLNAAYIDGSAVYHTPQDRPSYMDQGSLQHHGANALGLARAFGAADLGELSTPSANDATYFPVLGLLVRYPGWLVWPLAVLALLAVGAFAFVANGRAETTWKRVAAGFGLGLIPILIAPVAAQLLWALLVVLRPEYANMIDPWRPEWFRAAVVALIAAILLTWYGLLRRRFGTWPLVIGALGWLALLGVLLASVTPGGSYLAALPALFGAAAAAGTLWLRHAAARLAVLALGAGAAVLILAPTVLLFFPALGLATGGAAALFAVLLGLALLPVLEWVYPEQRRQLWSAAPAATAGVLAIAFVATGLVVDRFDAEHPAPTQLMYALDADTGQARWVSSETDPVEWTGRYITGREDMAEAFPILGDGLATGPAPAASLPAPSVTVISDTTAGAVVGAERTVTFRITPQRLVRLVYLEVIWDQAAAAQGPVVRASAAGRDVPVEKMDPAGGLGVLFHAPPVEGLTVTLVLRQTNPVELRVLDGSDGLSGLPGYIPRLEHVGIQGSHSSELVLVARTVTI